MNKDMNMKTDTNSVYRKS